MSSVLRYGTESAVRLELSPEALVAQFTQPPGRPLDDPAAAVAEALVDPIEFPPLAKATVPGDRVALALDQNVPCVTAIVAGVVRVLVEIGIHPHDITLVQNPNSEPSNGGDPRASLPRQFASRVCLVEHDATDPGQLCYLAASSTNRPIYVNRSIYDADVVLPVGCLRHTSTRRLNAYHSSVFPAFSNHETIERFRSPSNGDRTVDQENRQQEVDEASRLLGIAMTIGVIPGADGQALSILAGDVKSVFATGQKLCDTAWSCPVSRRAGLVVASIGGDHAEQSWENVGRALAAAMQVVEDDGAVVICSDLTTVPGPALSQLGDAFDLENALDKTRHDSSDDVWPAMQVIRALMRGPVYLLSQLEDETVQRTGMAPVADEVEINRLVHRYQTCILLGNAQHVVPSALDGDEKDEKD